MAGCRRRGERHGGLEPLSVDVVTAFQAYHWFDPRGVFAEADRIARKRARFAAVWNERDDADPFTRAYGESIKSYMTDDTESRRHASTIDSDVASFGWGTPRVLEYRYGQKLTFDGLIGRARSASYLPREGPAYDDMAGRLRSLFDAAAADGSVRFAYVTSVHLGERS